MNDFKNISMADVTGRSSRDPLRLLDELLTWQPPGSEVVWSAASAPVSAQQTADGVDVTVDLPGVAPEDLELTFQAGTLVIAGKRGERTYRYSVILGDQIDPDRIDGSLDKGVLTIHAHKRPETKPRKIAINANAMPATLTDGETK